MQTFVQEGGCAARGWTEIDGEQAMLQSVYVKVGFLGADYVVLHGRRPSGQAVRETLHPSRTRTTPPHGRHRR